MGGGGGNGEEVGEGVIVIGVGVAGRVADGSGVQVALGSSVKVGVQVDGKAYTISVGVAVGNW